MRISWIAGYLLAVVVVAVALLEPQEVTRRRVQLGLEEPGQDHILTRRWAQSQSDPLVPEGAAIFLGDSITEAMPVDAVAPYAVNYGIQWQTSVQLLESMKGYGSLNRAGVVFLNIGTNDVFRGADASEVRGRLQHVLDALPADRPLVWSGILPAKAHAPTIQAVNATIRQMCAARGHCTYVDTWALMACDGQQIEGYFQDGVHPTTAGYAVWVGELRRHLIASARGGSISNAPPQ